MRKYLAILFLFPLFSNGQTDANYPVIDSLITAGVTGGIPTTRTVYATLNTSHLASLQDSINAATTQYISSGTVQEIVLSKGTYDLPMSAQYGLELNEGVVLRGIDPDNPQDVIISTDVTYNDGGVYSGEKYMIKFDDFNAGLEDLTITYNDAVPLNIPTFHVTDIGFSTYHTNTRSGGDTDVKGIRFVSNSYDNWVDNVIIKDMGDHPIQIEGNHNTISNCFVNGSYKTGGGGQGYFMITGDFNLIIYNSIKRIRHLIIQLGAQYNVVFRNNLHVDVNYHDGDDGSNLVQENWMHPHPDGFTPINTGRSFYGHAPPDPVDNFLWRNSVYNNIDLETRELTDVDGSVYQINDYMDPDTDPIDDYGYAFDTIVSPLPLNNTFYPLNLADAPPRRHKRILIYYNGSNTTDAKKEIIGIKAEELSLSRQIDAVHDVIGFDLNGEVGDLDDYFGKIIVVNESTVTFNATQQSALDAFDGDVVYLDDTQEETVLRNALDGLWTLPISSPMSGTVFNASKSSQAVLIAN